MASLGGAPKCPACGKAVYFNDQKMYSGKTWHKGCFKCGACEKVLETSGANLLTDTDIVCNSCLRKLEAANQPSKAAPKEEYLNKTDPECCPRCGKKVYFAEQKLALKRKWHKLCFACSDCKKLLDSVNALDHEGELYCKACYGKRYGPKGYGYAGGAGTMLSMDTGKPHQVTRDNVPSISDLDSVPTGDKQDPDCCPRCGKKVYFAEQQLALGRKWHKMCFTCASCKKKVDSTSCRDHDGELYCNACHGKQFGPKGYGFAGGAGTMLSMDTGKPHQVTRENVPHTAEAYVAPLTDAMDGIQLKENGSSRGATFGAGAADKCARCGKTVYLAERKQAAGHVFHTSCFNCANCHKKLDSGNLTEKEGQIFCKACYGQNFGPKGYGFGSGAGTLQTS